MLRERTGAHPPGAAPGTRKALRGTDALPCGARRNAGREGGGASPAQAPGSPRAHIAPGKGASDKVPAGRGGGAGQTPGPRPGSAMRPLLRPSPAPLPAAAAAHLVASATFRTNREVLGGLV